jgi:chitodextrinase
LAASGITQTQLTLRWNAATDNVGVTGYDIYRNGTRTATSTATSSAQSGLTCGTSYVFGVEARDAAGNVSGRAQLTVSTSACTPPPPPPAPPAGVVELPATVSASAFQGALNNAPAGPVTLRPRAGAQTFTVTGDVTVNRAQVTIERGAFRAIRFESGASGSRLLDSRALAAHIIGASDVTWQRNTFDGQAIIAQNWILRARNFRIVDNSFANYYVANDRSVHTEALFVGALSSGLIQGNSFRDNGTTAHVFFSWWDGTAGADHPRDVCVKGNRFERALNEWFSTQLREEIPASSNIRIDPDNISDRMLIGNHLGEYPEFVRACG